MEQRIEELLRGVVHPELEGDIVSLGIARDIKVSEEKINVSLYFARGRDPFAMAIKRKAYDILSEAFPHIKEINIFIREQEAPKPKVEEVKTGKIEGVRRLIAVASGKGGVGKSTVTANLAVSLSRLGYKVGILDADIYGPSQPKMFGVEGFAPPLIESDDKEWMGPAENHGVSVMSIGFFIKDTDALVWRGPMATNALKQMIFQTGWGELDFLLIDLPPGTGDIHLGVVQELKLDGALIVTTPQQVALADVRRGIKMFRAESIDVPVLGIVENMAWFTPEELPDNRYYIFGRGAVESFAAAEGVDVVGQVPIILSVAEGGDNGTPASNIDPRVASHYDEIARKVVDKCGLND
jgi:ATP-binding protein involved in chromosome partitioning